MRIHLVTNSMLNGRSLQMCQDYWRPSQYMQLTPYESALKQHIYYICQHYQVSYEELYHKLSLIKAYALDIRCECCGKMYELENPCDLPNPTSLIGWRCTECTLFQSTGVIHLDEFLSRLEPYDDIPF